MSPHNGLMQLQDANSGVNRADNVDLIFSGELSLSGLYYVLILIELAVKALQYSHLHASAAKGRS